jgi:diadenosine tetraphosphatase ApaH/serine/threonine PP2A family protein phosphatase
MKLALLSDLHANMPALTACLEHARSEGAQRIAILGDLVGYGPHPVEVVEHCRALEQEGAIVLRGNHDTLPVNPVLTGSTWGDLTAAWTHRMLDEMQRAWLAALPLTATLDKILLVHASVDAPESWHYVLDERVAQRSLEAATRAHPEVRYVFGGHVHEQSLFYRGSASHLMRFAPRPGVAIPVPAHRQWLATVGSCGQPRDGDPRAAWALFDSDASTLTFHRVAYDHLSVARDIRAEGLPQVLASRMEEGR